MNGCVYVGGTFDLFHAGHVELLRRAAGYGPVIVALNSDEFAARYKRRPVMTFAERKRVVESCRYVYRVIRNIGAEDTGRTIDTLHAIGDDRVEHIIHGDDWTGEAYLSQLGINYAWIAERGITMHYLSYTEGISTREIIERCQLSGDRWINGAHKGMA